MSTVKASWAQLSVDGAVLAKAANLTNTLLATSSLTSEGTALVQIWVPDVAAADWMVKSVVQAPQAVRHLAWAHPESGPLLAGASESGTVYVWEAPRPLQKLRDAAQQQSPSAMGEDEDGAPEAHDEDGDQEWHQNAALQCGMSPIRQISFAPRQHGLILSAVSADGCVRIWEANRPMAPDHWTLLAKFQAATPKSKGGQGCTSMSWRCFSPGVPPLLAAGADSQVAIFQYVASHMAWKRVSSLQLSSPGAVTSSLHWAPYLGRPQDLIAASHGSTVDIFALQGGDAPDSLHAELHASLEHDAPVWKVEWNMLGTCLATATTKNCVRIWRPNFVGEFSIVSMIQGCSKVATEGAEDEGVGMPAVDAGTVD